MTDSLASSPPSAQRHTLRRRLIGTGVLLLVLLALLLTPPLLNVNRYRHRIAESMSQSLGRPVHLDNVSLHLLPLPGFTLQNLVVGENPGFGSEPTIRANKVEVSLRPSSLWRRQVEFSTVRFVEPSLNLVRNPAGRWNLQDLLVHASRVSTAPTAQARPGATPRFPYIEATGGRINLKLGNEKTPYSLTDANLAVWLPSPQQWRIRLVGTPARTDSNISDPGTLRLEGSLGRADRMAEVPVQLRASWHNAPLGEASRLLTGDDAGWRGTLQVDAALDGTLGAGRLMTQAHLVDLRRADFVPLSPLDVDADCSATADAEIVTLRSVTCSIPTSGPQPLVLQAPAVDLQRPLQTGGSVASDDIPLNWLLGWLRLFSTRTPATAHPPGTVDIHLSRTPAADWSGAVTVNLPPTAAAGTLSAAGTQPAAGAQPKPAGAQAKPAGATAGRNIGAAGTALQWNVTQGSGSGLHLQLPATPVTLSSESLLTLSGDLSVNGYDFRADGSASPAQVLQTTRAFPQLLDGLTAALPDLRSTAKQTERIDVVCARQWGGIQTCTTAAATPPVRKPRKRRPG